MAESAPARRVNVVGVVLSVVFLGIAAVGLVGNAWWFLESAAKWAVVGTIAVIGTGLLITSIPRSRSGREAPRPS